MPYNDYADGLLPLETFETAVFFGDQKHSQEVCNLVLSLALAYNDFRDVFSATDLIDHVEVDETTLNPSLGQKRGVMNTLLRIRFGFIHELIKLLSENRDDIEGKEFNHLLRNLSKKGKEAWLLLYSVATNKPTNDPLARALLFVRNKVAFHYDAAELGRSYREAFVTKKDIYQKPLLSRGGSFRQTRFFFADASSERYMFSKISNEGALSDFIAGRGDFIAAINQALYEIVTCFIQSRSPWIPASATSNTKGENKQ